MPGHMGTRSQRQKYRRRRQRAGLALLMSLVIIVLGITLFFRTESFQRTEASSVEKVSVPMIAHAPEAVAEQQDTSQDEGATTEEDKSQRAAADEPVAPVPATNDFWL